MTLHHRALAAVVLAAGLGPLGACNDGSTGTDTTGEQGPASTTSSTPGASPTTTQQPNGPIELKDIPAGTPLEAGAYAMPTFGPDSPLRGVVNVPRATSRPAAG